MLCNSFIVEANCLVHTLHDCTKEKIESMEELKQAYVKSLGFITERKIALQEDVDKLKKKHKHEENVYRALK